VDPCLDWFRKMTVESSPPAPVANSRSSCTNTRSMRSKTAIVADVTWFSPELYVEKRGLVNGLLPFRRSAMGGRGSQSCRLNCSEHAIPEIEAASVTPVNSRTQLLELRT